MLRFVLGALAILSVGVAFAACDGETAETLCVAGEEVFCKCRGGFDGTKTCLDDGNSFGECTTPEGPCPEIEETTTTTGPVQICVPDESVACSCDETGDPGMKTCASDGMSFGDCTTEAGTCGSSMGDKELYDPCASGNECLTGVCQSGYCTRSCEDYAVCEDGTGETVGECITLGGANQCAPLCISQEGCGQFGADSLCAGAEALDDPAYAFAACADWGEEAQGMPYGTLCDDVNGELCYYSPECENLAPMECDIGLDGVMNVCLFGECSPGCFEDADCPLNDCSDNVNTPCCESEC